MGRRWVVWAWVLLSLVLVGCSTNEKHGEKISGKPPKKEAVVAVAKKLPVADFTDFFNKRFAKSSACAFKGPKLAESNDSNGAVLAFVEGKAEWKGHTLDLKVAFSSPEKGSTEWTCLTDLSLAGPAGDKEPAQLGCQISALVCDPEGVPVPKSLGSVSNLEGLVRSGCSDFKTTEREASVLDALTMNLPDAGKYMISSCAEVRGFDLELLWYKNGKKVYQVVAGGDFTGDGQDAWARREAVYAWINATAGHFDARPNRKDFHDLLKKTVPSPGEQISKSYKKMDLSFMVLEDGTTAVRFARLERPQPASP